MADETRYISIQLRTLTPSPKVLLIILTFKLLYNTKNMYYYTNLV